MLNKIKHFMIFLLVGTIIASCDASNGVLVSKDAKEIGGSLYVEEIDGSSFLILDGEISTNTAFLFAALSEKNQIGGLLIAQSIGGDPIAAQQIGKEIQEKGMNTFVAAACFSACLDAFIAGKERIVTANARLGLNAWQGSQTKEERLELAQRYWTELGYSRSIMDAAFQVGPNQIWLIEPERAVKLGLATGIWPEIDIPGL